MIIESGIIIFLSFLLLVWRLDNRVLLREVLGHPLRTDLLAGALAYILHFGTLTGVMAAAVASLLISACISICRELYGYIAKHPDTGRQTYFVGLVDLLPDVEYTTYKEN